MERSPEGRTAEARSRRGIEEAGGGEDWRGEFDMEVELRGGAGGEGAGSAPPAEGAATSGATEGERERRVFFQVF